MPISLAPYGISIHPPRAGWDQKRRCCSVEPREFQSTHPVRGGTATLNGWHGNPPISIHPPRAGWDLSCCGNSRCSNISIHPPRVGWDTLMIFAARRECPFQSTHPVWGGTPPAVRRSALPEFQSTHPVWGGTVSRIAGAPGRAISIHPPRAGWDIACKEVPRPCKYFNPPTPCGVGLVRTTQAIGAKIFQSTHPGGGGRGVARGGL